MKAKLYLTSCCTLQIMDAERQTLNVLWKKMPGGGGVLLDEYGTVQNKGGMF